ncbi:hypothetical protein [Halorubellus salinus]|uniref:hypothetical protein n=1 Tax=Halorubellus salinus TaxID=755309 RepID=UPI001D07F2A3|nr:hypothetical protein [Halorubellus salinus]
MTPEPVLVTFVLGFVVDAHARTIPHHPRGPGLREADASSLPDDRTSQSLRESLQP